MALPPRANTCAPACDASVCDVATIPRSESTIERACDRSCAGASVTNTNPKSSLMTKNCFTGLRSIANSRRFIRKVAV
jgi:hypothetical protein